MYNAPTTAPRVVDPRPRATTKRLGRVVATLAVTAVAVATAGFMTPALAADASFGTLAMNGTAKSVNTNTAGNGGYVTFTGAVGQRIQLQSSGSTYGTAPTVQLLNPSSTVINNWTGNGFLDTITLSAAGTYTFKATQVGGGSGSISLNGWTVNADSTSTLTLGTPKTVTTTQGQNSTVTFSATAGQRFQFRTANSTYGAGNEPTVSLIKPDTTVQTSWTGNNLQDTLTLAAAGTYTLKVDPPAMATGSIDVTAWAVAADSTGTLAVNGTESNVSTTQGQNATLSFALSANQRLQLETSASSYATNPVITVYKPDGTTVVNSWSGNAFFDTTGFATAGTYTMVIDPVGTEAGSIKVQAWNVPADATTPITPGGTSTIFTTAQGQNSTGTFSLTAGNRVMVRTSGNTYPGSDPVVKLIAPDGTTVVQSWSGNAIREPISVSSTGTYSLLVDPSGKNAGSITAQVWNVPADQTATANIATGAQVTVSTTPGQNAAVSFAAAANQRVQIETSGNTYTTPVPVSLVAPDGTTEVIGWSGNKFIDTMRLGASAGTYTLKFNPVGIEAGTVKVSVWSVPEDIDNGTMNVSAGTAKTFTTVGGQNSFATIPVTMANQKIQVEVTGSTYPDPSPKISLLRPDGGLETYWYGNKTPSTRTYGELGNWKILVDPRVRSAGSITVTAVTVAGDVDAGTLTLDGTPKTVTTTGKGQNGTVSITNSVAGSRVQIQTSGSTFSEMPLITLRAPDGATLDTWYGNAMREVKTLPAVGTYTVKVDPVGTTIGSISIKGWSVDADQSLGAISLTGTPVSVTTTAGQNASMTFTGTAGDKVMFQSSGSTYGDPTPYISVTRGGTKVTAWYGEKLTAVKTLPVSGTFTIKVDPRVRTTGSITLKAWSVLDDKDAGTLNINGVAKTVTTTSGGQNAFIRFDGNADQKIKITTSNSTYNRAVNLQLQRPNGKVLFTRIGEFTSKVITLPADATYKLFFNPQDRDTGSIKVEVFTP